MLTRIVKVGDGFLVNKVAYLIVGHVDCYEVVLMRVTGCIIETHPVRVENTSNISESELKYLISNARRTSNEEPVIVFHNGDPVFKKTSYKKGDRFKIRSLDAPTAEYPNTEYILACTGVKHATLIDLTEGNRWEEPIPIESPIRVTEEELKRIVGSHYTFVKL